VFKFFILVASESETLDLSIHVAWFQRSCVVSVAAASQSSTAVGGGVEGWTLGRFLAHETGVYYRLLTAIVALVKLRLHIA